MERQFEEVDAWMALSAFSRDKHHEFGFPHPMELISCFVPDPGDPSAAAGDAPHPRPYFLFVGRLEKIKGLDDVIPLFRDYPEADLVVAGDGDHGPALRAAAADLPGVHFLGRLSPEALGEYYRGAISVLVPSVCYETFGIIVIEAFSQGTPVIARRLGPLPELVETAAAGELFDDAGELLAAMRRMQEDPDRREALGRSGRAAFEERWSEDPVMDRYLEIIRQTAERRGRPELAAALSGTEAA
jgi:glycosyltransferase involved in cell wall biosynthesis